MFDYARVLTTREVVRVRSLGIIRVRINQSGIQTGAGVFALASLKEKTTKFSCFVGVLNPIIHPPVGKNLCLFSDS
jgi:hypothetical protein